jgi:hypothetical protein
MSIPNKWPKRWMSQVKAAIEKMSDGPEKRILRRALWKVGEFEDKYSVALNEYYSKGSANLPQQKFRLIK